jgi:WD40 repeat protein
LFYLFGLLSFIVSRFSLLLLRISSGLLLPVVLLLAGAVFAGQMLSSNALLFMNGPDHFTLHDWSLQLRISFDLATDQRQRSIEDFQWLPDGRHLVFNRSVDGTLFEPFLYDLYSREIIPLDMATPDNHLPVWSAVTERWAWAASRDLMCISIRGDERSTCNNFEGAQHLTWSPDGQSLAFFEELRSRLLVLNVIDSEVVVLDTGSEPLNAVPLTWSADSR